MTLLNNIFSLVSNKIEMHKALATLFKLETQLASLSFVPMTTRVLGALILLLCIWINLLMLLGYGIHQILHNPALDLLFVLIFQGLILALVFNSIYHHIRNMRFEKTRIYLKKSQVAHEPLSDAKNSD